MSKRIKFFLTHLFLSFLIGCLIVGLVFLVWYPAPLSQAVGVTQIFLMLLLIDVIVGPLLGFFIYKEGKSSLKFDLTVIITLQMCALSYGVYSLEQGRPAWIVQHGDRFELIRKNDILLEHQRNALPQFQKVSWRGPQYAAVQLAKNANKQQDDIFKEVLGGISIAQQPERYVELTQMKDQIQQRAQDLAQLKQLNEVSQVESILQKYPRANAWLPLKANAVDMVALIHKESAEIIKIVDLRPWN